MMRWLLVCWLAIPPLMCAQEQATTLPEAPQPAVAAQVRDARWDAVKGLPQGESIELRERSTGVRTGCSLAYANDEVLTCDVYDRSGPARRVVYPHSSVDRVWVTRWAHGPSGKALLVAAGIGATVGGIAGAQGSAKTTFAGVLVGAGFGSLFTLASDPLGLREHESQVLVYKARGR